jgi:hypothetical protein
MLSRDSPPFRIQQVTVKKLDTPESLFFTGFHDNGVPPSDPQSRNETDKKRDKLLIQKDLMKGGKMLTSQERSRKYIVE